MGHGGPTCEETNAQASLASSCDLYTAHQSDHCYPITVTCQGCALAARHFSTCKYQAALCTSQGAAPRRGGQHLITTTPEGPWNNKTFTQAKTTAGVTDYLLRGDLKVRARNRAASEPVAHCHNQRSVNWQRGERQLSYRLRGAGGPWRRRIDSGSGNLQQALRGWEARQPYHCGRHTARTIGPAAVRSQLKSPNLA